MKHKTLHGIKHITTDRCKIAVQYRLGEMWIFKKREQNVFSDYGDIQHSAVVIFVAKTKMGTRNTLIMMS